MVVSEEREKPKKPDWKRWGKGENQKQTRPTYGVYTGFEPATFVGDEYSIATLLAWRKGLGGGGGGILAFGGGGGFF